MKVADTLLDGALCCGRVGLSQNFRIPDGIWCRRELSTEYTIALAAALMKDHVVVPPQGSDGAFRLHLIGCRWHVEGAINFEHVLSVLNRIFPVLHSTTLKIGLLGPEMAGQEKAESRAMNRAMQHCGDKLKIQISPRYYHESRAPAADFALVLNGGIDSGFGTWGPTLQLLLSRGTPVAFTGYAPYDKDGCERLLRMMGADVKLPAVSSPFRFHLGQSASDAFVVGVKGVATDCSVPATTSEMEEVHRMERIHKMKELEQWNTKDGNSHAVERLKSLRRDLENGLEIIPAEVTHSDLEQWAFGQCEAEW